MRLLKSLNVNTWLSTFQYCPPRQKNTQETGLDSFHDTLLLAATSSSNRHRKMLFHIRLLKIITMDVYSEKSVICRGRNWWLRLKITVLYKRFETMLLYSRTVCDLRVWYWITKKMLISHYITKDKEQGSKKPLHLLKISTCWTCCMFIESNWSAPVIYTYAIKLQKKSA